ncbi:MAG: DNA polymerase III subunit alpha [Dehalococcoidia bacterium]
MVTAPRTTVRAGGGALTVDHLQPLNVPRPLSVTCDARGRPQAVLLGGGWTAVVALVDEWLVEEEWWRLPIRRHYRQILLADDRLLTLFEDLEDPTDGRWYRQNYSSVSGGGWGAGLMAPGTSPLISDTQHPAPYVELHCHSSFSLREGASTPAELLNQAVKLGYDALALTDHDGLYGAMEFAREAHARRIQPIIGAELTLPNGHHLTFLVESAQGYATLCRLISRRMGTPRRVLTPHADASSEGDAEDSAWDWERELDELSPISGLIVLSGCAKGEIPALVQAGWRAEAEAVAGKYIRWFGRENVFLELQQNFVHGDGARNAALVDLAQQLGIGVVATNNVHYHERDRSRLHDVLVAIRHRTTLDASHQLRRANSEFYLKAPTAMVALFDQCPEAIAATRRIAERCAGFDPSRDLGYAFPIYDVRSGHTPDEHLAAICREALDRKYNLGEVGLRQRALVRLEDELALIKLHKLAGFFLTYRDILALAGEVAHDLHGRDPALPPDERPVGRGRGSSVSSIVCYLIGLSHVDPVRNELFLGRFLNEELGSVPDIDLDFPRDIRAELIERMYTKYQGRVGLVCILPTYRLRSAVRDVGKALGLPLPDLEKLARLGGHWSGATSLAAEMARIPELTGRVDAPLWRDLIDLTGQIAGFPRHVSQHVGGMVISAGPLVEAVPLEPTRMPERYVIQWDKDAADDARFVKIDFLALGMLSLVDECLDMIQERHGRTVDFSHIGYEDPEIYERICEADTVGLFQIESRAQIQTLPHTQPRTIDDLAVEVAIVRPGPIVGGAFRPYMDYRRRLAAGATYEELNVHFDHDLLKPVLRETLGVILYQEQVLQVAMAIGGFSIGEAESLRRSMSRHRSLEAMEAHWPQFRDGARANDVPEATARTIFDKLLGFASFGFPKSHAVAFARLAYESAWLRYTYPAEYICALFNNQPMGFYSVGVLTGDAKRHGVAVLGPDINRSAAMCTVEDNAGNAAVRLGLSSVREVSGEVAEAIVAARGEAPFRSLFECIQRTGLARGAAENLILAGAFDGLGLARRDLLWQLGLFVGVSGRRRRAADGRRGRQSALPLPVDGNMVDLPPMSAWNRLVAEHATLDFSPGAHPLALMRAGLGEGVHTSRHVARARDDTAVRLAGLVVSRQQPTTAKGVLFILLEDEFGLTNVVVHPALYDRQRLIVRTEPFVIVDGVLQRNGRTSSVRAHRFTTLRPPTDLVAPASRDFH